MSTELVMTLTEDNYDHEVIEEESIVFVDFWADWCMPCKMIAILIDELAKKYTGQVKFCKVNVDDAPSVTKECGITALPTLLIYRDRQIVERVIGAQSMQYISTILDKLLST